MRSLAELEFIVVQMDGMGTRRWRRSIAYQVVNALIKPNKAFDLLVIPGAGHTNGGPYGERKRNDFFVHNLLGVEPPDRNAHVASTSSDGAR